MKELLRLIIFLIMQAPLFLLGLAGIVLAFTLGDGSFWASFGLLLLWAFVFGWFVMRLDRWGWYSLCDRVWPGEPKD